MLPAGRPEVALKSVGRELRGIVRTARAAGWAVYLDGRGHLGFRGPAGERVTIPAFPRGKTRQVTNYTAKLRRAGVPGA